MACLMLLHSLQLFHCHAVSATPPGSSPCWPCCPPQATHESLVYMAHPVAVVPSRDAAKHSLVNQMLARVEERMRG